MAHEIYLDETYSVRDGYAFRYFFNAGYDKVTGLCDAEGTDVFTLDENGGLHYVQSAYGILPADIMDKTEEEFDNFLAEYAIF